MTNLIVLTTNPSTSLPHQSTRSTSLSSSQARSPRVGNVLVVAIRKNWADDLHIAAVNIRSALKLSQRGKHVAHVCSTVTLKAMNEDDNTLDIGRIQAVRVEIERGIVDQSRVSLVGVLDVEVSDLSAWDVAESVVDASRSVDPLTHELLSHDGRQKASQGQESST